MLQRPTRGALRLSRRRCLIAAAAAPWAAWLAPAAQAAAAKGEAVELPPLTLIDGSKLDASYWKGHAAVIVFWSTDCPFCKRHNARLDKLYRSLQARSSGLRILGVATDRDQQAVRRHVAEHDFHFPVALDSVGLRPRLTERAVVPMTVLIDRNGRLLMAIPGEMSEGDITAIGAQLG